MQKKAGNEDAMRNALKNMNGAINSFSNFVKMIS